jgi:3-hydroxy-3-methylglutaryl CoA synthase
MGWLRSHPYAAAHLDHVAGHWGKTTQLLTAFRLRPAQQPWSLRLDRRFQADYALAIGMDIAQGRPGDALEYTAGAGGAAYLLGPAEESLAEIESVYSFVTDTPDFWRRAYQKYPEHGQRFTGEPAYFKHITEAAQTLMEATHTTPADYQFAVFHQPNTKFPERVAAQLFKTNLGWNAGTGNQHHAGSNVG